MCIKSREPAVLMLVKSRMGLSPFSEDGESLALVGFCVGSAVP